MCSHTMYFVDTSEDFRLQCVFFDGNVLAHVTHPQTSVDSACAEAIRRHGLHGLVWTGYDGEYVCAPRSFAHDNDGERFPQASFGDYLLASVLSRLNIQERESITVCSVQCGAGLVSVYASLLSSVRGGRVICTDNKADALLATRNALIMGERVSLHQLMYTHQTAHGFGFLGQRAISYDFVCGSPCDVTPEEGIDIIVGNTETMNEDDLTQTFALANETNAAGV